MAENYMEMFGSGEERIEGTKKWVMIWKGKKEIGTASEMDFKREETKGIIVGQYDITHQRRLDFFRHEFVSLSWY